MKKTVFLFLVVMIAAGTTSAQMTAPPAHQPPMPQQNMDCQAMMQQMHAGTAEMDQRLKTLVEAMNGARGSAKVDRMAAVVNELVAQRTQMRERMMTMMPMMMQHMSQHMQSGMMKGMSESMSGCPMMQGTAKP